MKIILAQMSSACGGLEGNLARLCSIWDECGGNETLIVFPELCLTGYPPEDLVENTSFLEACDEAVRKLVEYSASSHGAIVFSHPRAAGGRIYNTMFLISGGAILATVNKVLLPNYGVFDEKRNFTAGVFDGPVELYGRKIGFLVCEDAWSVELPLYLAERGAEVLISLNASPFDVEKAHERLTIVQKVVEITKLPFVYLNMVGAQDELVFDGGSFALSNSGDCLIAPRFWEESNIVTHLDERGLQAEEALEIVEIPREEHIYNALIMGLRTYVKLNGFEKVLVAVSGGVDSALVAALAVDALGPNNVTLVRLPSKYSSSHSLTDAAELALCLCIEPITISIEKCVDELRGALSRHAVLSSSFVDENLQSRVRGVLMMGLSNASGALLLSTGNKSEYACGYATLYGDMCGGFAPLKDVYKTCIYELARYRNANIPSLSIYHKVDIIPSNSIIKPPSAELHHGQLDTDSLPPYEILDKILFELVERDGSVKSVAAGGFDERVVARVMKMITGAEYKRKQAPIGPKISTRNFSKDRRYPITNLFKFI